MVGHMIKATTAFNAGFILNQADERVIPFLMALNRERHAVRSIPAEAQGPKGPKAGQSREGAGANGEQWPQGIDSHRSGKVPSTEERWECIEHLRHEYKCDAPGSVQ